MGDGAIYQRVESGELVAMNEEPYDSEDVLQALLEGYPQLLAGEQLDATEPLRFMLIQREMGIGDSESSGSRWSIDHLFVDQHGVPTLVEVKRSSDSRIRREVIGQLLEYAANASSFWRISELIDSFEAITADPDETLSELIGTEDPDAFWDSVKANLRSGRMRLVFVADNLPPETKRVIEFLNEQTDPLEVLGVEVHQYRGSGREVFVPEVIGQTQQAQQRKAGGGPSRQWDETSFMAALLEGHGPGAVRVAKRLLEWARSQQLRIWWGRGLRSGSFIPIFDSALGKQYTFAVWTNGTVEMQFQYMARPPFESDESRLEIVQRLNKIETVDLDTSRIDKRPWIPLSALAPDDSLVSFLGAMDSIVEAQKALDT